MKRSIFFVIFAFVVACTDSELMSESVDEMRTGNDKVVVSTDTVSSKVITLEEARTTLENFLRESELFSISKRSKTSGSKRISEGFALKLGKRSLSKASGNDADKKIYVFNFEDEGGFALMSASRETPPIFAITDGGNLDTAKEIDNPGFAMFMATLETKIMNGDLKSESDSAFRSTSLSKSYEDNEWSVYYRLRDKDKIYKLSSGLCPYWHQNHPYNTKCPEGPLPKKSSIVNGTIIRLDSSGHYPAGCVPVACALLMSTYRYPASYSGIRFDWNAMISGIDDGRVATLLSELGKPKNLNTKYGIDSSMSNSNNIPRTLKNFGYSNGGRIKDFSCSDIYVELKKGYPVLISGCSFSKDSITPSGGFWWEYSGGHQWIGQGLLEVTYRVDHFRGEGSYSRLIGTTTEKLTYILCNMGWGNCSCNGYYLGSIFDTNKGPVFDENGYSKRVRITGDGGVYKFNFKTVTGIRK